MSGIDVPIHLDEDDTWFCEHVERSGQAAAPTRLCVDQTLEWNPGHQTSNARRWILCPDCGTYWRVWVQLRVAKPSVECSPSNSIVRSPQYCRVPVCDIDRVIDIVKRELPEIRVAQHQDARPADDDGVWWFSVPMTGSSIQVDSSTGMCPVFIEHDRTKSPAEGGVCSVSTPAEAAKMIIEYLLDPGKRIETQS